MSAEIEKEKQMEDKYEPCKNCPHKNKARTYVIGEYIDVCAHPNALNDNLYYPASMVEYCKRRQIKDEKPDWCPIRLEILSQK